MTDPILNEETVLQPHSEEPVMPAPAPAKGTPRTTEQINKDLRAENKMLREELQKAADIAAHNMQYIEEQEHELEDLRTRFLQQKKAANDLLETLRTIFASQESFIELSRKALLQVYNSANAEKPRPTPMATTNETKRP